MALMAFSPLRLPDSKQTKTTGSYFCWRYLEHADMTSHWITECESRLVSPFSFSRLPTKTLSCQQPLLSLCLFWLLCFANTTNTTCFLDLFEKEHLTLAQTSIQTLAIWCFYLPVLKPTHFDSSLHSSWPRHSWQAAGVPLPNTSGCHRWDSHS